MGMDLAAMKAAALDQAGDAVIVIDHEGIVRVWNGFAERLFGWTAEQMLGHDVKTMIPERLRAGHDRGFSAAMESGRLRSDGTARRTKALSPSGEPIYVIMTFALVMDADGRPAGSVAVARRWDREAPQPAS